MEIQRKKAQCDYLNYADFFHILPPSGGVRGGAL